MKDIIKLILVLTIICTGFGALLAVVNHKTKEPIKQANAREKSQAIKAVLPDCDNDPNTNTNTIYLADGKTMVFHVARKDNQFVGVAFLSSSAEGYGGDINVMVGITADQLVQAIKILPPKKETPGLGANIESDSFRTNFHQKPLADTTWKVRKDGGDIVEITAATISSRAVVAAVKAGIDVFTANEEEIRKTGEQN